MNNVPTSQAVTPDEPVTRAQMLRHITDAVESGLPAPMSIALFIHDTGTRHLQLRMDDNRADEVDAWVRAVSPDDEASAALGHNLFEDSNRPWRSYNYETSWHGWGFYVWSSIDESQGGDQ